VSAAQLHGRPDNKGHDRVAVREANHGDGNLVVLVIV
jgi:hypothetical protein